MKIFNLVFILLFVVSAALQYNDPDPYIWIPLYLYAALLCYLAFRKRYRPLLYYTGLAVYFFYALVLLFSANGVLDWWNAHDAESLVQSMQAEKPWVESAREFFGLVIMILVLVINMLWLRNTARSLEVR
jgi:hypothetical protein